MRRRSESLHDNPKWVRVGDGMRLESGSWYYPLSYLASQLTDRGWTPPPSLACPTCSHYRDTPNHELGCPDGPR